MIWENGYNTAIAELIQIQAIKCLHTTATACWKDGSVL